MVYNSLTEAPRNLKECIDWLVALKGTSKFNTQALGFALYKFLVDKPVGTLLIPSLEKVKRLSKEFLEHEDLRNRSYVKDLLSRFKEPMNKDHYRLRAMVSDNTESDYENFVKSRGFTADDIARNVRAIVSNCEIILENVKNPDQYNSAYSSEATWAASCSKNPEACAVILVGIAPMLYAGIESLRDETEYANRTEQSETDKDFRKVLKALGYVEPEYRDGLSRSDVCKAVTNMHPRILPTIYDVAGFWAFY
ncbi:hypothetical protein, conserved [Babesia ovata]|uniref:Uncharacterized protein n=1 Tax=Babesia ovata TaxID=189622 RepID=A0A2H6KGT0_9APIC|nr:uncharacterized protein BOVATA_036840 [Babesia ovata]GBE62191.1 hypothetical protein, conserved [Babesia ovata]